jgi:hypothetical protein
VDSRIEELVARIDDYFEQEIDPAVNESVEELRRLMILAVTELGGPGARDAFLRKVAAEARAGALSAASGAWAQGSPNASAANLDSLHPNSRPAHYEDVEAAQAMSVFAEVAADLSEEQTEDFKALVEDVVYSVGEGQKLRARLTEIKNQNFVDPSVSSFVAAISRTVRK